MSEVILSILTAIFFLLIGFALFAAAAFVFLIPGFILGLMLSVFGFTVQFGVLVWILLITIFAWKADRADRLKSETMLKELKIRMRKDEE